MKTLFKPSGFKGITPSIVLAVFTLMSASLSVHADEQSAAPAMPAPEVGIISVENQLTRTWTEFSGRLAAVEQAEIKPLVGGELQQVLIEDGQYVEKGDLLFVIDPRPFQAQVNIAKAQLASAESNAKLAEDEYKRREKLVGKQLVSESEYDSAKNQYQISVAAINEAKSNLAKAELDLQYCYVKAPLAGRVSRAEVTVGNIIEAGQNVPVLTTLVVDDTLYAEFDVDEQTYIQTIRNKKTDDVMPVEMTLAANDKIKYQGQLYSFDNELDTATGTIRTRAIFVNTDRQLLPGMFAKIRLGSPDKKSLMIVPQKAIGTNQDKKFVYVLDDQDVVTYREVTISGTQEQGVIIASGLQPGERVVVNGLMHIRPNVKVSPKPVVSQQ